MARILVGYDGSPPARRALDHAIQRARTAGDELLLATIIPAAVRESTLGKLMPAGLQLPPALDRTFEQSAALRLEEIASEMASVGVKVRTEVRAGDAGPGVLAIADELQASEIVIGHKAFEGPHLRLGPNAEAILRGAKVPVTVVP